MHELHLQAIEQNRSLIRAYGVFSKCSLSDLVGFSPATAFPPDIMHDCLKELFQCFYIIFSMIWHKTTYVHLQLSK